MTTITINERTKAGKALLELANLLATNNKGVTINIGLEKPAVKVKNQLIEDFENACKQLKTSRLKNSKRKS